MTDTMRDTQNELAAQIARHLVEELCANTQELAQYIDNHEHIHLLGHLQIALAVISNIHDEYSKRVDTLSDSFEWLACMDSADDAQTTRKEKQNDE